MLEKAYRLIEKLKSFLSEGNKSLFLLIILSAFFCFWRLGSAPLNEWDESRNGINAIEMLHNGDYINLFYAGQPDTWNAKPPLMIWLIAGSYKIFGFNEFALRFPAALAAFLSILVLYHLILLYTKKSIALLSCIMLLGVDGIIGDHVGRTGDFDALLLLFLLLSIYHFLKYTDFNKKSGLIFCSIFLGLAFYTKGLASLIILPGLFMYTLIRRKTIVILKDKILWFSAIVFLIFITSWYTVVHLYGLNFSSSIYGTEDSFQTMWKYDIVHRLTSGFYDKNAQQDLAFFFSYLDVKFNIWNYIFYLTLLFLAVKYIAKRRDHKTLSDQLTQNIRLLSCCIFISIGLLLSVSAEAHFWYMTPALPFLAIFTATGSRIVAYRFKAFPLIILMILTFTLSRKIFEINTPADYPESLLSNTTLIKDASSISVFGMNRQDYLLYLKLNNPNVKVLHRLDEVGKDKGELLMVSRDYFENSDLRFHAQLVSANEDFIFMKPQTTNQNTSKR